MINPEAVRHNSVPDDLNDEDVGDVGDVGFGGMSDEAAIPQALPVRPRQIKHRTQTPSGQPINSRKTAPQQDHAGTSAFDAPMNNQAQMLANQLQIVEAENEELALALNELEDELAAERSNSVDIKNDFEYIDSLLTSMGVPSDLDGQERSIADRIVYLNSQQNVATTALSSLRNELMSLAHSFKMINRPDVSQRIFKLLEQSNRLGSFIVVSDAE